MKLIVKNPFIDKLDHVTVYEPGHVLEVKDKKRATDLVNRGLCEVYKETETKTETETETETGTETGTETETGTGTETGTETETKTAKGKNSTSKSKK